MVFETVSAPHVNVNDLEMTVVDWLVKPWDAVEKNQMICEVETTKSTLGVESPVKGFVYPVVKKGMLVKVGEPLAHIFAKADPKQLEELKITKSSSRDVPITHKARALMDEFGLTVADFPRFTNITSDTVIAKIRELKPEPQKVSSSEVEKGVGSLTIDSTSIVLYGEKNLALLALDALRAGKNLHPVAWIDASGHEKSFYDLPVLPPDALGALVKKGLKNIFLCAPGIHKEQQLKVAEALKLQVISVIHPSAEVSSFAQLGQGVFLGARVVIGPDVTIGDFSQVLCAATIAHHSRIGKFVTIADGTHVGGNVSIGDGTLIGIGVNINKRVTIGKDATVVSGATVIDDVKDNAVLRISYKLVHEADEKLNID